MPFPQRRKLRLRPGLLVLLMIALAGLALYALALELGWLPANGPDVAIVDSEKALGLLVLAIGLRVSLAQHSQSVRPYLVYQRERVRTSAMGLPQDENGYWRVSIRNAGRGLAIFSSATYGAGGRKKHLDCVRQTLKAAGLTEKEDYVLARASPGFALAPGLSYPVAEVKWRCRTLWPELELTLEFESLTGVRYTREIHIGPPG